MNSLIGRSRWILSGVALATFLIGPARGAPVTFAQYFQTDGSTQQWTISTSSGVTSVTATGSVYFLFSGLGGLPFSGPQVATFNLQATSSQAGNCGVNCGPGDSFVQPGYAGTFSFIDNNTSTNLLSGTFAVTGSPATTGAQFSSSIGSSGGSFNASATTGNLAQLTFTSQYLTFANQTQEDASWSLSSLIPNFSTTIVSGAQAFPSDGPFHASGSGTFSSNPGPAAVPEPESAGFLGFGLVLIAVAARKFSHRTKLAALKS